MKTLTNQEIIWIITHCEKLSHDGCENNCPLFAECYYYWSGEKCGSALEKEE